MIKKVKTPWNRGIPTKIPRCSKCGMFLRKDSSHFCKQVELKGKRLCEECGVELKNKGWERYSKICGRCGKIKQREQERQLKIELIKQFGGKCQICEYNKYIQCLEFHHLDPSKKDSKHFLKEVKKYPEKFNLLCNRCHREWHLENNGENKEIEIDNYLN